jgi:preprotein translocase subunit Sec63
MTFKPGESGNPNGRPPGSENKLTRRAKYLAEKLFDEFEAQGIDNIAKTGDVKDLINLLSKFLPTKVETESTVTVTQPIKIEFED